MKSVKHIEDDLIKELEQRNKENNMMAVIITSYEKEIERLKKSQLVSIHCQADNDDEMNEMTQDTKKLENKKGSRIDLHEDTIDKVNVFKKKKFAKKT